MSNLPPPSRKTMEIVSFIMTIVQIVSFIVTLLTIIILIRDHHVTEPVKP